MTRTPIAFNVNGEDVEVLVKPWQTLLEVLRDELRLTGTKEGCSNGNCGACTVQFDGMAIDSCLALGLEADGHDITTIEGVATGGSLHPIQQAFIDYGSLQCGFCTPGFIMSAKALLERMPNPSEHDIRLNIAGNLCRCTGYDKIVRAIQDVVEQGK
jgi:carbon-monoxide dehydrogenase small subunit